MPNILQMSGAKIAARTRIRTTAPDTTATLSLRRRSRAIRVGDRPVIFLPELSRGTSACSSPGPRVSRSATVMVPFPGCSAALDLSMAADARLWRVADVCLRWPCPAERTLDHRLFLYRTREVTVWEHWCSPAVTPSRLFRHVPPCSMSRITREAPNGLLGKMCGRVRARVLRSRRLRHRVDTGLLALGRGDRTGGTGERVAAGGGLGKRDHVADALGTGQQGNQPVDPERDAAVRRRAVREGVEQEPELAAGLLVGQADHVEDPLLHLGPVDTDRAPADLRAVEHDVVGPGERLARPLLEVVGVLLGRRREGVVDRRPALSPAVHLDPLEHRRVDHPDERPGIVVDQVAALADLEAG